MLPLGHAAGGYLTGVLLARTTQSGITDSRTLRLFATLGGLLPDIGLVIYQTLRRPLNLKPNSHHHTWITHTFPFYFLSGGLLAILANRVKRIRAQKYITAVTTGACVHLLQDMFGSGDGIQALYPFTPRLLGFRLLGVHGKEWRQRYVHDPIFLLELGLIVAALLHLVRTSRRVVGSR
jgi:membrane-bound metal-dependent hydrolase YbcI (DUF457 family)